MSRRRGTRGALLAAAMIVALAASGTALAQDDPDFVTEETEAEVTERTEVAYEGWDLYLNTALGFSLAASNNVIGATDGNTWTVGGNLHFGWYYTTPRHEWRNDLRLRSAFARTPLVDEWAKSSDELDYLSLYLYRIPSAPWVGPFARFRLKTAMFAGVDVRADDETYVVVNLDGTTETVTASRLRLTDPFQPLTLRETVGVFFSPELPPTAQFEALVGFGARQTFADDQLALSDDDGTDELEVIELESFNQAGSEIILNFWGQTEDGIIAYNAGAEFMTPFINDLAEDDDRDAFELTNILLTAGISIRPYDWLSIDYVFNALREPQLLDDFQITNQLLVSLNRTFIERRAPVEE